MTEQNKQDEQAKDQQDKSGESGGQQEKSAVNKAIDKAQEKGLTDKAANMVKNKLKGR